MLKASTFVSICVLASVSSSTVVASELRTEVCIGLSCESDREPIFLYTTEASRVGFDKYIGPPNEWYGKGSADVTFNSATRTWRMSAEARSVTPELSIGATAPYVTAFATLIYDDVITISSPTIPFTRLAVYFNEVGVSGTLAAETTMGFGYGGPMVPWGFKHSSASSFYSITINGSTYSSLQKDWNFGGHELTYSGERFWLVNAGVPTSMTVLSIVSADAPPRSGCVYGYCVAFLSSAEADFSHTFNWGGVEKVVDLETGQVVDDWILTSASGIEWGQAASVPESSALVMMLVGLVTLALTIRNRHQNLSV